MTDDHDDLYFRVSVMMSVMVEISGCGGDSLVLSEVPEGWTADWVNTIWHLKRQDFRKACSLVIRPAKIFGPRLQRSLM
ncbi:hypothetical protein [Bradyrhizobium valentinum]|uniref:Uncharacterized protein n=1 Tax=Bradyrhizobium valentinum TaxID=1518501 RepID=A0A0R3LNZ0_9BRAD|nr:hypothetical protein [Bradyrhizobium valentinum]KRR06838.1 hypothetical protein CP49_01660 [Bradyrhizobium valentinum]